MIKRCQSPICIMQEGIRGRMFEPGEEGLSKVWCQECVQLGSQLTFYASKSAQMIRDIYSSYINTDLPKPVKLILEQFAREIVGNFGEEL